MFLNVVLGLHFKHRDLCALNCLLDQNNDYQYIYFNVKKQIKIYLSKVQWKYWNRPISFNNYLPREDLDCYECRPYYFKNFNADGKR